MLPFGKGSFYEKEKAETQKQADRGGNGDGNAYHEHIRIFQRAEQVGQGDAHPKGGDETLYHDKDGFAQSVEIAEHTEREGDNEVFKGTALEIQRGLGDHVRFLRKDACKQVSAEKGEEKHGNTEGKGDAARLKECAGGPFGVSVADILRDKSGKGGQEGHGNNGQKHKQFFRDPDARRFCQTDVVDDGGDNEKGYADEKILQGDGRAPTAAMLFTVPF